MAVPNSTVSVPLFYNTSNGDNTLTGITLRLHYNSNELSFQDVGNLFSNNLFVSLSDQSDTTDFDKDPNTDKFIQFGYLDFFGNWPNQALPLKLGDFNFTTTENFDGTQIKVTSAETAAGYTLESLPISVNVEETPLPSLAIAATNATRAEGNEGLTPFTFTVTRTGDTTVTSSAEWAVTGTGDNPATADDFGGTLPTGTITFAAGVTSQVITVNVQGDTVVEPNETFTVTLSEANNATITTPTATGTIINDDNEVFTQTSSGFVLRFNDDLNLSVLNLYSGFDVANPLAPVTDLPDLTLIKDGAANPINGSLIWDETAKTLTFVKTGDILEPGSYTLTLDSRPDGLVYTNGDLIDVDGDGTPGSQFEFTVGSQTAVSYTHLTLPTKA